MNPNISLAKEQFRKLTNAYQLLIDERRRAEFNYKEHGSQHAPNNSTAFCNHRAKWDDASEAFLLAQHRAFRSTALAALPIFNGPEFMSAALGHTVESVINRLKA
jgi:hypothetical protein